MYNWNQKSILLKVSHLISKELFFFINQRWASTLPGDNRVIYSSSKRNNNNKLNNNSKSNNNLLCQDGSHNFWMEFLFLTACKRYKLWLYKGSFFHSFWLSHFLYICLHITSLIPCLTFKFNCQNTSDLNLPSKLLHFFLTLSMPAVRGKHTLICQQCTEKM